ncbi:hypothetical protein [Campylobacter aviculae]|uniref:hypothetical protein n=1 Tax=Campylobacter aviculae TaxID=2510190 RepID=UPI001E517CA9|nr:hypothetical protein [Campylobacter aviculae]
MTKEKIISYEEFQANPMLQWFFDKKIKHSIKDKYYKEWQDFINKEGINVICIIEDPKGGDILELDLWDRRAILDPLFHFAWSYDYEFFEFILQFVKDQTWLNFLLACNTIAWGRNELDLEHTKKLLSF